MTAMMKASVKQLIETLLGKTSTVAAPKPAQRPIFSIGIYAGRSPVELGPVGESDQPVITRDSVTDVRARFVADPFMMKENATWHMFFEVVNRQAGKGEIGLAESQDGYRWKYRQIVLRESFHLSYPYVFEWQGEFYMIPESYRAKAIRLYKAAEFPRQWTFVKTLLEGDDFVDPSIFYFNRRWWLFTDLDRPPFHAGILRLFHSENLEGPWIEHPKSPVLTDSPHISRPAGRVLVLDDKIIRYSQDCAPVYGTQVRAFEITELTTTSYRERPLGSVPVVGPTGSSWNESGMHHIDAHRLSGEQWIACVDGFHWEQPR